MTARRSARQTQKDATRELLLEAATTLLAEEGYAALRVAAVAKKAGVSLGGMLHHFATKEAMVLAVIERLSGRVARLAEQDAAKDAESGDVLKLMAESAIRFYAAPEFLVYLDIFLSLRRRTVMADTLIAAMTGQRIATEELWVSRLTRRGLDQEKALQIVRSIWGLARGLAISSEQQSKGAYKKTIDYSVSLLEHSCKNDWKSVNSRD